MATNVDVSGLHLDWEAVTSLRARVRDQKKLFVGGNATINMKTAEVNTDVLIPLLKKLVGDSGVGMAGIPALELE